MIEVPESRPIAYGELPRIKTTTEPGHQRDFTDEYYARRHLAGETLEKRGRKQERDRLIQDRNKLRYQYEHLKSELASAAYYASASPLKGIPKTAAPINTEKLKETERIKKKQLQQTEDTLRRYEELLEPSRTYLACRYFGHWRDNDSVEWGSGAHYWTTGGKGKLVFHLICKSCADCGLYHQGFRLPRQASLQTSISEIQLLRPAPLQQPSQTLSASLRPPAQLNLPHRLRRLFQSRARPLLRYQAFLRLSPFPSLNPHRQVLRFTIFQRHLVILALQLNLPIVPHLRFTISRSSLLPLLHGSPLHLDLAMMANLHTTVMR